MNLTTYRSPLSTIMLTVPTVVGECLSPGNFSIIATRSREQIYTNEFTPSGRETARKYGRAIWLKSDNYRLIGKADLIESHDGEFIPGSYKRGSKGEWDNDELQVCAQALCLEEMTGKSVDTGYIYYASSHQRQPVAIDLALRQRAIATLRAVETLIQTGKIPPAVYSPRCKGCSLFDRCLPRLTEKVQRYREED